MREFKVIETKDFGRVLFHVVDAEGFEFIVAIKHNDKLHVGIPAGQVDKFEEIKAMVKEQHPEYF